MNHKRQLLIAYSAVVVVFLVLSTAAADFADWIFADSFESGDTSAWTSTNGPLGVIPGAASEGAFGLRVPLINDEPAWVQDENPFDEGVVRSDFDINADSLSMTPGDDFAIYIGWVVDETSAAFVVSFVQETDQRGLRFSAQESSGGFVVSPVVPLPGPGWHRIGIEYGAGTGPNGTGEMRLFINGALEAELNDFDNDGILVESLRLGAVEGIDQGTTGSVDFDVYTSVRLFDPWPCTQSSSGDPTDTSSVCLDGEGQSTAVAAGGGCDDAVVVWRGLEDLGNVRSRLGGIYGKKVSGTGSRQGPPFLIVQDENASEPDIAMDPACRSFVTWRSAITADAIFAGIFDPGGGPVVPTIFVAGGGDSEDEPAVAVDGGGRFLVTWRRSFGPENLIWGRYFGDDGQPLGTEFQIDGGGGGGALSAPATAMNATGLAVVAWENSGVIVAQLFDDGGAPQGIQTLSQGQDDGEPSVAMMSDGGFVAVWTTGVSARRIHMVVFDSAGAPLTGLIRVDSLTPADCSGPQVSVGPNDRFTVVWSSLFEGVKSIRGRSFSGNGDPDGEEFEMESQGHVWVPTQPRVAVAERLLVSFSEQAEYFLFARGALIGARRAQAIFADGFESGDSGAWFHTVP